jgi:hypothetical protein
MENSSTVRLEQLIGLIPGILSEMNETDFGKRPAPGKWSPKEITGHLVDSAANNHQRFVRAQYEELPLIVYDPDEWNRLNGYEHLHGKHVVAFWELYNRHLLAIIRLIPEENLEKLCRSGKEPVTLGWLIDDYVRHLEHHLSQLTELP